MNPTVVEEFTSTPEGMRSFQQERTILEITMLIRRLMKTDGVSKTDLANRLGKSKSYITQLLDGRTNMTLRTISDVMHALGKSLHLTAGPISLVPDLPQETATPEKDRIIPFPAQVEWLTYTSKPEHVQSSVTGSDFNYPIPA